MTEYGKFNRAQLCCSFLGNAEVIFLWNLTNPSQLRHRKNKASDILILALLN